MTPRTPDPRPVCAAPTEQELRAYAAWVAARGAEPWIIELALDEMARYPHNSQWLAGYRAGTRTADAARRAAGQEQEEG